MKTKNLFMTLATVGLIGFTSCKNSETTTAFNSKDLAFSTSEVINQTPNIVEVAAGNKNFSTLVTAVKAADLASVLSGKGPFTVFAPTNAAFAKLPKGTIATLLKPENKATLSAVLTYHVVAGKFNAAAVVEAIKANKGKFTVPTVQGGKLIATLDASNVILTDEKGNKSTVVIADVPASNGIIHAIDTVVMPN